MYDEYGYYYEDAVQDLASDMLDKIAEEIEYEDGMERTAGIFRRKSPKKPDYVANPEAFLGEMGSGKNDKKGASAGIRKFIKGVSPQNAVKKFNNLNTPGKFMAVGIPAAGAVGVAGLGIAHANRRRLNANGQEKAAAYFEEAEIYKEAAEEAYDEALAMEEAALNLYDYFEGLY